MRSPQTHQNRRMHSDMIVSWQSIRYEHAFVLSLLKSHPNQNEQSTTVHSECSQGSATDDDVVEVADSDKLSAPCPITDDAVITLANHLEQRFDGLPETVCSALKTLRKSQEESELDFAKRRLIAVLPTLLSKQEQIIDPVAQALNDWHRDLHHQYKNDLEQTLAETVYYYDEINNRLIIRHSPVEILDDEANRKALLKQEKIADRIIALLPKRSLAPTVHHIIPSIIPGTFSLHCVLKIRSDLKEVTFDPATSYLSKLKSNPTYHYVGVQRITNDDDCGRHVTVMAIVAFLTLLERPDKSAATLNAGDFLRYPAVIEAKNCKDSNALKKLITDMRPEDIKPAPSQYDLSSLIGAFTFFGGSQGSSSAASSPHHPAAIPPVANEASRVKIGV